MITDNTQPPPNPDFQSQLVDEKMRVLYEQAPGVNITIIVITVLSYLGLSSQLESGYLLLWAGVMLSFACIRLLLWYRHKIKPQLQSTREWLRTYTFVTGLLGLVFGACYFYGYNNQDYIVAFILILLLAGVISGAAHVMICYPPAFIVYTYPQAFIFAGVQFSNPTMAETLIAICVLVYLAMLTVFVRNSHGQFVQSFRLLYQNEKLIDELNQEVKQREDLVRLRTNELLQSNDELEKEIQERKEAQSAAGLQLNLLNSILNATPDFIYYKDYQNLNGQYIGCNEAYAKLVGLEPDEIIGKTDKELYGEQEGGYLRAKDKVAIQAASTNLYEEWVTYPDGEKVLLSALKTPFYDQQGTIMGVLGVGRDITELKRTEEQLKRNELSLHHLAHHDTLTELPNRLLLIDRLQQSIQKARRAGKGLAVLFIDVDNFKEINDSLGHSIGDQLLQAMAQRLKETIRKEDTAARLGGDEFTIILEELDDSRYAASVAEKLIDAFKQPLQLDNHEMTITISIGISLFPEHGNDTETLLRNADAAMYLTKKQGRDGYSLYTEDLTERAMERVALESALRKAIEQNEFELHYQPQFEISSGRIIGVEALIRWQHPDKGELLPERFIALAEETGLITDIGFWVIRESCEQIVNWGNAGIKDVNVSINISGRQLLDKDFADNIHQILKQSECKPSLLGLEITEGYLIQYPEKFVKQFEQLRDMGVQLAIDDFGTGYSSLTYLKQFPISKLKIDNSFVRDVLVDPNDAVITRAIIALGKSLGLTVLAEGVETEQQMQFVSDEGCNEVQGNFLARPMLAQDLLEFLKQQV